MRLLNIFIICGIFYTVKCAKILVILPSAAIDFHKFYRPVVRKLSEEHELVVVTSQPMNFQSPNMTVYELAPLRKIWDDGIKDLEGRYPLPYFHRLTNLNLALVEHILADPNVQSAFDKDQNYDIVAVEFFGHSPLYAFAKRFNCPLVGLAPNDEIDHEAVGNLWNYYQYPHPVLHITGQVLFKQGMYAVWVSLYKRWFVDGPANKKRDRLIKKYFGHQIATTKDLTDNVDLVIMDAPHYLNFARPVVPVTKQLGWFHIEKPAPLPLEVDKYLNESRLGVIYINFNSESLSKPFVPDLDEVVLYLSSINGTGYDILCNWDDTMTPPVKGIKFIRDVPQQSILSHPKVILFAAEASIRNMEEAVWYNKPMLGLKNHFVRNINDAKIEWSSIGLSIFHWDFTNKGILLKTTRVLSDRHWRKEVKKLSNIVMELSATTLDTVDWWVGYVLRHKGSKHLKYNRGKDFNFFQYYMIDIFIAFGITVILSVAMGILALYLIYRKSTRIQKLVQMVLEKMLSLYDRLPYRIEIVRNKKKKE